MYSMPLVTALALYGCSTVLYMLFLAGASERARPWARAVLLAGAAAHLAAIAYHHAWHRDPPILASASLINLGVFLVVAAYLVLHLALRTTGAGGIVAPFATVVLGTLLNNAGGRVPGMKAIAVLTPVHVATSAVGFLFFAAAFAAATLRLVADARLRERHGLGWPRMPPIASLDRFTFAALRLGFPFYTVGIILGAIWAWWGSEAGGDPSATPVGSPPVHLPEYVLGVGVWVLYAALILAFTRSGWRGRKAAVLVIAGFMATLSVVLMYAFRRLAGP